MGLKSARQLMAHYAGAHICASCAVIRVYAMTTVSRDDINPAMLSWARKRVFPTVEAASERLKVPAETLKRWESGEARPTFRQARTIAKRLYIHHSYLFMQRPPLEEPPLLPDLRVAADSPPTPFSVNLMEVINDAKLKQQWYREEMRYDERPPLPYVGQFGLESPIKT